MHGKLERGVLSLSLPATAQAHHRVLRAVQQDTRGLSSSAVDKAYSSIRQAVSTTLDSSAGLRDRALCRTLPDSSVLEARCRAQAR